MKPSRQSQERSGKVAATISARPGGGHRLRGASFKAGALALALLAVGVLCVGNSLAQPAGGPIEGGNGQQQQQQQKPSKQAGQLEALESTQAIKSVSKWRGQETKASSIGGAASSKALAQADMETAAGHHYGKSHGAGHGKYYMYAESPKKGSYKAGFKRGNHKHMIERKEWQHKAHAGGHMKWHSKKGKGSHKWEFKHYDKKAKGHHHHY